MPEFLELRPASEALDRFLKDLPAVQSIPSEIIPTERSLDRILAESIHSPEFLPPFNRSTVDGYAVQAKDTFGSSSAAPAYLQVSGEIPMGEVADVVVNPGEAVIVHTGGMIPQGADAVVMLEDTQEVSTSEIEVLKAASVGQNIIESGEDVNQGDLVFEAGMRIRSQEIGGLMALGFTEVTVAKKPSVGIISTGDELISPSSSISHGKIRDINSYTLSAIIAKAGGDPIRYGIVPDDKEDLFNKASQAHQQNDLVIITAGSSVSARDQTAEIINILGEPGVLIHGVMIKPGKPTILGIVDGKPLIGLPGNPVSALIVAGIFVVPLLRRALNIPPKEWVATVKARMSTNISSLAGREDYLPVALHRIGPELVATPVYGRSNLIFTLIRADGLVIIPAEATGIDTGTQVEVIPFD